MSEKMFYFEDGKPIPESIDPRKERHIRFYGIETKYLIFKYRHDYHNEGGIKRYLGKKRVSLFNGIKFFDKKTTYNENINMWEDKFNFKFFCFYRYRLFQEKNKYSFFKL